MIIKKMIILINLIMVKWPNYTSFCSFDSTHTERERERERERETERQTETERQREREVPIFCDFSHHVLIIITFYIQLIVSVNLPFYQMVLAYLRLVAD